MLEEQGVIEAVETTSEGKTVIAVQTSVKTTCGTCAAKSSCGTSTLAEYFTPKADVLYFETEQPVSVGQTVSLGIREQQVLFASFLVYLLPLLWFIAVVVVVPILFSATVWAHELVTLALALATTLIVYKVIKAYLKMHEARFAPHLCHILPIQSVQKNAQIPISQISDDVTKD